MSTAIQRRRGTTAQHASFAGLNGELTVDTDKEVVVVHDGATAGGYPMMRENGSNSALALGSAATPSLKFTGDTNTGIYSPGADQVAISTGGSGRLFIDSSGNVGVGTANPVGRLTIKGAANATAAQQLAFEYHGTTTKFLALGVQDASGHAQIMSGSGAALIFYTNSDLVSTNERLRITSTGALNFVGAGTAGVTQAVSFNGSAPVNSIVIDSSGRLGVGTSSPTAPLHVVSTSAGYTTSMLAIGEQSASTGRQLFLGMHTTDGKGYIQSVHWGTAYKELLLNPNGGNVGIGTSSPQAIIHSTPATVNGGLSTAFISTQGGTGTNTGTALRVGYGSTDGAFSEIAGAYENPGTYLDLKTSINNTTAASTKVRITAAGNVGIGTTSPGLTGSNRTAVTINSPTGQLSILEFGVNNALTGYLYSNASQTTLNSQNTPITFDIQGERARIDSSGRLLVGTSTASKNLRGEMSAAIVATGNNTNAGLGITGYCGTPSGAYPLLDLQRSRGVTDGSMTVVASGDTLGALSFRGADGTNFLTGASIIGEVDGTPGTNDMPGRLVFSTTADGASSPTERMRITNGGKVLIGTTSDLALGGEALQVSGTGNPATFKTSRDGVSGASYWQLIAWNSGNSGDNGFIQFGTETSYTARGSITYNRGSAVVAYNTTSDYRAKTILGGVTDSGETIDALKVYRGLMNDATVERPMLIAHEAQKVAPYCVTGEKDAVDDDGNPIYQQIDHQVLVPLLIAEIQQLRARVAALESA